MWIEIAILAVVLFSLYGLVELWEAIKHSHRQNERIQELLEKFEKHYGEKP